MFYKREGKERWLGPGKVVFQDGKVVFVRHGGVFVRVSPNRLQKMNSYSTDDDMDNDTSSKIEDNVDALKEVIENRELHPISEYIPTRELHNDENQDKQQNRKTPKMNDIIQYKLQNSDEWIKATVTGRAGKATGKNKYWYNIKEDLSEEKKSINLEQVDWELLNGVANVNIVQKNECRINAGNEYFEEIMISLRKRFVAGKIEERNFEYIGFRIVQETGKILLDQSKYVDKIKNKTIDPKRAQDKESILTSQEQSEYRQLIGQINWAVQGARPDMAFELIDLSTKLKQGNIGDLSRAIKVVNRMKDIQSILSFPSLNRDVSTWKIIVFTDASLCNINSGTGSTGGHIIWLKDSNQKCCPLYWNANARLNELCDQPLPLKH